MKICQTCKKEKDSNLFSKNKAKSDGYHTSCKECKNTQQKKWYDNHKDSQIERVGKRNLIYKVDITEKIVEFLLANPCVDCGEKDPIVLEFDHVRGTKYKDISGMLRLGYSWANVKEEIEKCDVRCRNCHIRKTAKDYNYTKYQIVMACKLNG